MIEILLQHKRPDGSIAILELEASIKKDTTKDKKELLEILFRTEVGANESGDIRAHIFIKED